MMVNIGSVTYTPGNTIITIEIVEIAMSNLGEACAFLLSMFSPFCFTDLLDVKRTFFASISPQLPNIDTILKPLRELYLLLLEWGYGGSLVLNVVPSI